MPRIPFPKKKVTRRVALEELAILERSYPHAVTALEYKSEFQLLIAVILSAQTTDARVNMTTPALFAKYPTPQKLARARQADVENIIRSTGFFRMKARTSSAARATSSSASTVAYRTTVNRSSRSPVWGARRPAS